MEADTYLIIVSRSILLRMRNCSVKFVEIMKRNVLYLKRFFENRVVYKIVWTNRYCRTDKLQLKTPEAHSSCVMDK